MKRRDVLKTLTGFPLAAATGAVGMVGAEGKPMNANKQPTGRMPVIFLAHGAPVLLDDAAWASELAAWANALPRPEAILMVSAHWEQKPVTLGAINPVPLVYDFYGFPDKYYRQQYPAPGAPRLASRVRDLLAANALACLDDPRRGLDHGAYVPLVAMYPKADIPVLQISLPTLDSTALYDVGRALAPLRDERVLIVGSGFLTHNMRYAGVQGTPQWARDFDAWSQTTLERRDLDALLDFRVKGPAANIALPTVEHFVPVIVAAGAAGDKPEKVTFPITGFWMNGAFTKRSVQFG